MSEIAQEVGWAPEASSAEAPEEAGGYGLPADGGEQAWGPSPDEWAATQQTIAQQSEYIAAIAQLLGGEEQQPGFDPFGEDALDQVRAIAREEFAPFAQFQAQQEEQAALQQGEAEASRIIADTASRLGATVDDAEVRQQADNEVVGLASQVLANAGYVPSQIKAFLESGPLAAYDLLAQAYGKTRQDVARAALQTTVAGKHAEATRPRGPYGVLKKFTGTPVPRRELRLPAEQTAFINKRVRGR